MVDWQKNVRGDSRNAVGLEISKIYFSESRSAFSKAAFVEALNEMIQTIHDGPLRISQDLEDTTPRKWKYGLKDVDSIIDKAIANLELRKKRWADDKQIYLDEFLENSLDGKRHTPKQISNLPIPESELIGKALVSTEHYLQRVTHGNTTLFYLRNTLNRYFVQGLSCHSATYKQNGFDDVDYTLVWGSAEDSKFTVGVISEDEFINFIFDADEVYAWSDLHKGVRLFLNSGTPLNLRDVLSVSEQAI